MYSFLDVLFDHYHAYKIWSLSWLQFIYFHYCIAFLMRISHYYLSILLWWTFVMLRSLELLSIALIGTLMCVLMNSVGHISRSAVRGQSGSRFSTHRYYQTAFPIYALGCSIWVHHRLPLGGPLVLLIYLLLVILVGVKWYLTGL